MHVLTIRKAREHATTSQMTNLQRAAKSTVVSLGLITTTEASSRASGTLAPAISGLPASLIALDRYRSSHSWRTFVSRDASQLRPVVYVFRGCAAAAASRRVCTVSVYPCRVCVQRAMRPDEAHTLYQVACFRRDTIGDLVFDFGYSPVCRYRTGP